MAGVVKGVVNSVPDGGRRVVRQVGIAQAALGYTINSLGACLVLLAAELGSRPEELAWLSSSFGVGLLVVGLAGRWVLGSGTRPALLGSALVAAVGTVLLATGAAAVTAAAGALLLGLGSAGFVLVTPALLRGPDAAAGLARANAAASVSALFGPLAIGALTAAGLSGRLALLVAVPALLFLAADTRPRPTPGEPRPALAQDRSARSGSPAVWRVAGVWAAIVIAVSIEFCFTIWSTARLQGTGMPAGAAAVAATAFLIGMAAGRLAAPRLIVRRLPVIPAGCGLAAAGTLVVALFDAPVPVTAGLVLAGLGVAPFYPVTLARLIQVPGLSPARSAAYGALASGTAILAAPATLAALGSALDLRTAYLVTVLPMALVLAAATLPGRARA